MKVAILTIHKIINYGSALQTYALQKYLENINISCDIINYKFPNNYHRRKRNQKLSLYRIVKNKIHRIIEYLITKKRRNSFQRFWKDNYHLTMFYPTQESIKTQPPIGYDMYILGSDQVWNTNTLCGDDIFMFSFLDSNAYFFSYASSFGVTNIDNTPYCDTFKKYLSRFKGIGVREKTAVNILDKLSVPNAQIVCDPTFLLKKEDYAKLAGKSILSINEDYILVYMLNYSFNPHPAIRKVVEYINNMYNCKIVFIGRSFNIPNGDYAIYNNIGPYDFLYLFQNAKFVVTSSFHGTAFSIINRKPFVSIAPLRGDNRIQDLLEITGLKKNLIYNTQEIIKVDMNQQYDEIIEGKINTFIMQSKNYIINHIHLKSASNLNGNLNCSKELEHYAS